MVKKVGKRGRKDLLSLIDDTNIICCLASKNVNESYLLFDNKVKLNYFTENGKKMSK